MQIKTNSINSLIFAFHFDTKKIKMIILKFCKNSETLENSLLQSEMDLENVSNEFKYEIRH